MIMVKEVLPIACCYELIYIKSEWFAINGYHLSVYFDYGQIQTSGMENIIRKGMKHAVPSICW